MVGGDDNTRGQGSQLLAIIIGMFIGTHRKQSIEAALLELLLGNSGMHGAKLHPHAHATHDKRRQSLIELIFVIECGSAQANREFRHRLRPRGRRDGQVASRRVKVFNLAICFDGEASLGIKAAAGLSRLDAAISTLKKLNVKKLLELTNGLGNGLNGHVALMRRSSETLRLEYGDKIADLLDIHYSPLKKAQFDPVKQKPSTTQVSSPSRTEHSTIG